MTTLKKSSGRIILTFRAILCHFAANFTSSRTIYFHLSRVKDILGLLVHTTITSTCPTNSSMDHNLRFLSRNLLAFIKCFTSYNREKITNFSPSYTYRVVHFLCYKKYNIIFLYWWHFPLYKFWTKTVSENIIKT